MQGAREKCQIFSVKPFRVRAQGKYMVLVQRTRQLAAPNCSAPELIDIPTLGHKHISRLECRAICHRLGNRDLINRIKFQPASLDIGHTKIGTRDISIRRIT